MFLISTVARLMKIRSKPRIYHIELHSNTDKEPMATVVCFSFFLGRLKSQHALKVSGTSWGYTVIELNISQGNQPIRVGFVYANPTLIGRAKTKGCRSIPGHPFSFPSACFSSSSLFECSSRVTWNGKRVVVEYHERNPNCA